MGFEVSNLKENSFYALDTLKESWVLTVKQFFSPLHRLVFDPGRSGFADLHTLGGRLGSR